MIGIFGGSGLYELLGSDAKRQTIDTRYGTPSAPLVLGSMGGIDVAFLPRHGLKHEFPPHLVPFRANLWAMKTVGVDRIIGPCAVGSLLRSVEPGQLVVADQLVDRTWGRASTFSDGPEVFHISLADPYCTELRPLAIEAARASGATVHERGTVVVVQGPRFSTRAESAFFAKQGWEMINMTQHPEAALARELEMCYVNISVVTDYDVGILGEETPVSHRDVLEKFAASLGTLKEVIGKLVPAAARTPRQCECAKARGLASG